MVIPLNPPLKPRDGRTLKVLGIARISTENQDQKSLEDQMALKRYILDHYQGRVDWHFISSLGSGEYLDRKESLEAQAKVESGALDLIIAEDLGRIFRRMHAYLFCETCQDNDTRLIAINDHVDTAQGDWQLNAFFAAFRHETYNRDTSARIKRSLDNRFLEGGVIGVPIYGYIKPRKCKHDSDLRKDPKAKSIIDEMIARLESGATYSEIADWLNDKGVQPGPHAGSPSWTCPLVPQFIHNTLLKGLRVRGKRAAKRVNSTGRRKSVKQPMANWKVRHCPHLAFVSPEKYDRLITMLDERNAKFRRGGSNGHDPRTGVPKKRTVWPGQHIFCGICGRLFRYGGHGQNNHLLCKGAYEYRCWNAITVDGPSAAKKMLTAIRDVVTALPDFDATLLKLVQKDLDRERGGDAARFRDLNRRTEKNHRELEHLLAAVRQAGPTPTLTEELHRLESEKQQLDQEKRDLDSAARQPVEIPSMEQIRKMALKEFARLPVESPEFCRLIKQLIPKIEVYPYRLCDGGHVVLRARFTLRLASLLPAKGGMARLAEMLEKQLEVELFDPPQRAMYRARVKQMTKDGMNQEEIASQLGITQTAVQRALGLDRKMEQLGLTDPYVPVKAPPKDYNRLRRHLHRRFKFEPLDGDE